MSFLFGRQRQLVGKYTGILPALRGIVVCISKRRGCQYENINQ